LPIHWPTIEYFLFIFLPTLKALFGKGRFRKAREFVQSVLQFCYPLKDAPFSPGPPSMYLFVQDGPSGTNTRAALPVAAAILRMGTPIVVLSNSHSTIMTMTQAGIPARQVPTLPTGLAFVAHIHKTRRLLTAWRNQLRRDHRAAFYTPLFFIERNFSDYVGTTDAIQAACLPLFRKRRPTLILTLTETHPYALAAAALARDFEAIWVGWFHMLIMDIPDYRYFPADYHLFYGDHGKAIYERHEERAERAVSIGTPLYDAAFHRSKEADAAVVRQLLPDWNGCPLVVIGTENRDNQIVEIEATLQVLQRRKDIYTVIKLHPDDSSEPFELLTGRLRLSPDQFSVVKACDLDALLNTACVLITTFSNIIINAALLKTPIISHNYSDVFGVDFAAAGVGFKAKSPETLADILAQLLENPEFHARTVEASRRAVTQFMADLSGKSAAAIAKVLTDLHHGSDAAFSHGISHSG